MQPRCSSGGNAFSDCTATMMAAQEDNPAEVKVPPDAGARRPSVAPGAGMPGRNQLAGDGVFSCGRPGHGVNRCSWVGLVG